MLQLERQGRESYTGLSVGFIRSSVKDSNRETASGKFGTRCLTTRALVDDAEYGGSTVEVRHSGGRRCAAEGGDVMAVTITVAELAEANRIGSTTREHAEVSRLRDYCVVAIADHLGRRLR